MTTLWILFVAVFGGILVRADPCTQVLQDIRAGQLAEAERSFGACTKYAEIEEALNQLKRKVGDVSQKLSQAKLKASNTAPIEPSLQWAQSPESVFINVKFAHKLDAPACIDVIDPTIEIEESRVLVRAGCRGFDKHFKLDLILFSPIVAANSSWSMTSVGRGSFTLLKQSISKWDRLLSSREKPKNLHVWWAMQEKFDSALDALKRQPAQGDSVSKDSQENTPSEDEKIVSTNEEDGLSNEINVERQQEDQLHKEYKIAKKRLEDQSKRAKKEIEEKAAARKTKLQKEIDAVLEEQSRHIAKLDDEMKSAQAKLDRKLSDLNLKRSAGQTISWGDDDITIEEEHTEGTFWAAAAKVLKKAFGVDKSVKEEV